LPVLGFIPQDIPLEILEISKHITPEEAVVQFPGLSGYRFIQSGDAHMLEEILGLNELFLERRTISEIRSALTGQKNRSARIIEL
jgi:hypothetical protein